MYKIDNEAPPPSPAEIAAAGAAAAKYPWNELGVNDSFFVPLEGATTRNIFRRLRESLNIGRKRGAVNAPDDDAEFVWAERESEGVAGVRVWRTK